ncbi:ribonuclease T2-like [Lambiella insularis]|nr:ribonuclease T2-like [Lambiella insularis]
MPYSLPSVAKLAVSSALFAPLVLAGAPAVCSNTGPLSCHNTTAVANTCCFNAPGGQLLQTQFWDTNPATGPAESWTIHGLWPDNCDGTYQSFCDASRQYTNITAILKSFGATSLLNYMNTYWLSDSGTNEAFWEHEWGKHGTCISTFDTKCYTGYKPGEEVVDFFNKTVSLYKTLDTYAFLEAAGITPSSTKTYTSAAILAALQKARGVTAVIQCSSGALDEAWYFYDVKGSVQTGTFVPENPVGSSSDCPATGVKYLPK